ncbi:MAG: anthranilate phosphoribosyltransferase [bacterium]
MIKEIIKKLVQKEDLNREEAYSVMLEIMSGRTTDAQIGSFLTALSVKGETVEEITGCAAAMREKAACIKPEAENLLDTCGTGGDKADTFNISTCAALIAAGAGAVVAKHGNRSVTSKCGSADVLAELGVNIGLAPEKVNECINRTGIGFMFAPNFHPAMKYAIGPRREMGIRTIFNILGPLTNPAGARSCIMGLFSPDLLEPIANVLLNLNVNRAFVVHGDGMDEISLTGVTQVCEIRDEKIKSYLISPEKYGFNKVAAESLKGGDAAQNAEIIRKILNGERGPLYDAAVFNAGFAITAAGLVDEPSKGIDLARKAVENGGAQSKLSRFIKISKELG